MTAAIELGAERCPLLHEPALLLEQIAASISSLGFILNRVRQSHLDDLARKVCPLGGPIAKSRPKSMHRQIIPTRAPKQLQHGHIAERPAGATARNTKSSSPSVSVEMRSRTRSGSGTRCSLPAFMRSAGTVQSFSRILNSERRAPITSLVLPAVGIVNSSARAATPSCASRLVGNAGSSAYGSALWCCALRTFDRDGKSLSRCPRHRAGFSPWR
jgi:hypothetical protein